MNYTEIQNRIEAKNEQLRKATCIANSYIKDEKLRELTNELVMLIKLRDSKH